MDVTENSVPLNPMILLIIIPIKWLAIIGNANPTFSDKPKSRERVNVPLANPAGPTGFPKFPALDQTDPSTNPSPTRVFPGDVAIASERLTTFWQQAMEAE